MVQGRDACTPCTAQSEAVLAGPCEEAGGCSSVPTAGARLHPKARRIGPLAPLLGLALRPRTGHQPGTPLTLDAPAQSPAGLLLFSGKPGVQRTRPEAFPQRHSWHITEFHNMTQSPVSS